MNFASSSISVSVERFEHLSLPFPLRGSNSRRGRKEKSRSDCRENASEMQGKASFGKYNVLFDAGSSQSASLFAASVTDFDHALPIWHPLAQLPLNPLRTHRKFAGFDPHAATLAGVAL